MELGQNFRKIVQNDKNNPQRSFVDRQHLIVDLYSAQERTKVSEVQDQQLNVL
jgi:hypothetical protein